MKCKKILVPCSAITLSALMLSACSPSANTAAHTGNDASEQRVMVPADKFDLTGWKIAIPTDDNNDGKVDEISVKDIQTYQHPDYFYLDAQGNMVFTTPNKAFTTPNSSNTRSELHQVIGGINGEKDEFANNFSLQANKRAEQYSQIGGNLQATLKVNHVAKRAAYPEKAPAFSVVVGQIHAGKDQALVAEGEGYGYGNEPLKIFYKKRPDQEYGSVFWNYERNLEKENSDRQDISYLVWGKSWLDTDNPGEKGIALDEAFSYEVNVYENIMYLTFTTARHGKVNFEINLADNIDANGMVDKFDHPAGYTGDVLYFKAGAYDQCSIKDDPGFWYPACLGTGDWKTDKANGDYAQVSFMRLVTGPSTQPEK
ncbi:MAG: polysaccharide lyase family 7 protein [Paraglaciecola sp.]|uniref:polysaccharide lyase family 7 protein n=1 Tax=Paraglaciecola sp. TaxID=1920173 RepID=UPI00273FC86E|nr:polysaccharide lyase family 7 protein [Paraglaciecola sp.]MDP5031259.1 polysaccharide lyase family 7 protein [Paraglaciecola sp.]MDP5133132.1 polysaccharide lyase family 7 protein [Paraglaciecola sp.]